MANISDSERNFIEEVGLDFEQTGLPRMSGRLFGWLLISEPPHQSPAELAEVLNASKGSISTSIRLLVQMGFVERYVIPGSRHDYFRLPKDAIKKLIRHGLEEEIKMFRSLSERGLEMTKNIKAERKTWLKHMHSCYLSLEKNFPELMQKCDRE